MGGCALTAVAGLAQQGAVGVVAARQRYDPGYSSGSNRGVV